MTTKNTKHEAGSVADWYNSFTERAESISKKIQDDEDPWDDICLWHKVSFDLCDCCIGCGPHCDCESYFNDLYYDSHGCPIDGYFECY